MNRIKKIRVDLNLSQTDFARQIGVSQQTLSSLENDTRPVSERNIISICSVFGVDEHWLRTGEGEPFPLPPQEDLDFQDALMRLCADDVDPWKKKLAIAAVEAIFKLPEEFLPFVRDSLRKYNDALEEDSNEKDEG